jgi:hypothetical protein
LEAPSHRVYKKSLLDGDGLPSCSAAEALDRQEPFVNPTLANHALALLARLFRYGTVPYHRDSAVCPRYPAFRHYVLIPSIGNGSATETGSKRTFETNAVLVKPLPQGDKDAGLPIPPHSGLALPSGISKG